MPDDYIKIAHKKIKKIFFLFLILGISPLFVICFIYIINPDSEFLNYIYNKTNNIPAITSKSNKLMTKVMDSYCKTSPFFGFLWFLFSVRIIAINNAPKITTAIKSSIGVSILCFLIIFISFFFNHELTTSGRLLRLLSVNDLLLLFFYSVLYAGVAMFTYLTLMSYYIIYKISKHKLY